jgi:transposase
MSNFRPVDRDTGFLMPPSVDEWLPERHLARLVVEVIAGLDLRAMTGDYRGSGEASYHPSVLLELLVYGCATGVFSSRKLERASYDSVAFRFIAANQHPDHDTIASFRRRFLKQIETLFVQVLVMAREMGVLKLGTVALDGTKIHADANRHSALSYERAGQIEMRLREEVGKLTAMAEAADQADVPDGMSIPEELARREQRRAEIARARAIIEARAKQRYAREQAEHAAKMAAREARSAETGKPPSGRPPAPPVEAPGAADQVNLTDEASRIMPVAGGGFEQCYKRPSGGGRGQPSGGRRRCGAGAQRQAASAADAGGACCTARRTGQGRNFASGYWIFRRSKRQCVRCRGDRSADRAGPAEPLPAAG